MKINLCAILKNLLKYAIYLTCFLPLFVRSFLSPQRNCRHIKLKLKNLTPLKVLSIVLGSVALYFLYKFLFPYDLMRIVLEEQNIFRFKVTCNSTDLNNHYESLFNKFVPQNVDELTQLKNLALFQDYYLNKHIQLGDHTTFDLNQMLDMNSTNELLKAATNFFKICFTNPSMHVKSKTAEKDDVSLLYKRFLSNNDLKYMSIVDESGLSNGGYFKPSFCIQDFLYIIKNSNTDVKLKTQCHNGLSDIRTKLFKNNKKANADVTSLVNDLSKIAMPLLESIVNIDKNLVNQYSERKEKMTAIIIPFMNREKNLIDLLLNLHPFLQRQYIHYRIFVAEQSNSNDPFNKGRLYNMAFTYVKQNYKNVNCFILHDVDLIPESDFNLYECDNFVHTPRHLSLIILKNENYIIPDSYKESPYELLVGGVLCIKPDVFERINGFSNTFWNWGGEDDDLAIRLVSKDICVTRPKTKYAVYKMVNHASSKRNPVRENLLFSSVKRMKTDGLNNLKYLNVSLRDVKNYALFTHLKIYVGSRDSDYLKKNGFNSFFYFE